MDSLQEAFQKAILAHGQWKNRLIRAIETGKSEFTVETVKKDNHCEFGKWIYTGAPLTLQNTPEFQEIKRLHAEFHVEAAKIIELALAGKKTEAEQRMKIGGPFLAKSASLIRTITACKAKNAA